MQYALAVPAAQATHKAKEVPEPAGPEKAVPAGQGVHEEALSELYCPTGQGAHVPEDGTFELALDLPAVQGVQVAAGDPVPRVPGGHGTHALTEVCPVRGLAYPSAHEVQEFA